ncbi:hypothetical protein [Longimicrobium terrae]|uniref:Uncharacterized protein n=1 Tax=Longimicrobium terrae TaxID=1639882 RepID=A0A841H554_9BACT|nr:hypothetical protein [Longimicrobium terrae]MBB4638968.1 hypothetical protein [Longimicrobium terrae]MBB6073207.1 hypothetical protein [Longimicrobium terrae]NNC32340.1 hypothetical protein [Longimicrobium terrae]
MRAKMTFAHRWAMLAAVLLAAPLHAQHTGNWRASAVHAVMDYRASVLADTTAKFERCSVDEQVGAEALATGGSASLVRMMVGPCWSPGTRHFVRISSISGDQNSATVRVRVYRGEWEHDETYSLLPLRRPELMWVDSVSLSSGAQFYRARPISGVEAPAQ